MMWGCLKRNSPTLAILRDYFVFSEPLNLPKWAIFMLLGQFSFL